jgi:uncharacterized protein
MARVAITGATGLLGGALAALLEDDGHRVHRISRRAGAVGPDDIVWDPAARVLYPGSLEGVDAVVHLAAEPIGNARWTAAARERLLRTRVDGTRLVASTLARLDQPPKVLVSASAVGVYGSRGDEVLTEESAAGDDFLAGVCEAWESAAEPARAAGIRVVHPRTGVVLADGGPLIEKVRLPFRLGIGGRIGNGRQWVPWISLIDHARALRHLIDTGLEGPVNVVAPEPVTNRELTRALGAAFHRPAVLPVPLLAVRLLYGEMGATLAASSQRVVPERLLSSGFEFRYTDVRTTLLDALAA